MASASHLRLRASPAEICAFGAVEDFRSEDSRSEIYPQSGPNCAIVVEDIATVAEDGADVVDIGSVERIVAGQSMLTVLIHLKNQLPVVIQIVLYLNIMLLIQVRQVTDTGLDI